MAVTKARSVQYPVVYEVEFTYADITTAVADAIATVPAGSTVVGGEIIVDTAWDTGTTHTLEIGDGDDPNRYSSSSIDLKTAGRTALTLTGYEYTAADDIEIIGTESGTVPTQGSARIFIHIVRSGKANEVHI